MHFIINNDPHYHEVKDQIKKLFNMYDKGMITEHELIGRLTDMVVNNEKSTLDA